MNYDNLQVCDPHPLRAEFNRHWNAVKAERLRGAKVVDAQDEWDIEDREFAKFIETRRRRIELAQRDAAEAARLSARRREMLSDRLRAEGLASGSPRFSWYGVRLVRRCIVWDTPTDAEVVIEHVPHREAVGRNALDAWLRSSAECVLTIEHDFDRIIARRSDGSLQLRADGVGLRVAFAVPHAGGTSAQSEARERLAGGELRGMSWTPIVEKSRYDVRHDATGPVAVVTSMQLSEVCLCDDPAYRSTLSR